MNFVQLETMKMALSGRSSLAKTPRIDEVPAFAAFAALRETSLPSA